MTYHHPALARVLALADARADETVAFAAEFLRQPSVNPDLEAEPNPDAERPAQEWLRARLAESGAFADVDLFAVADGRPNVVATRPGVGGGRSLTWAGHTDVVPVTPEQAAAWSGAGPFAGEVRDGRLWGRGASDMKGAIAAYVTAARLIHDAGVHLRGDLILAQACGEESGRRDLGCNAILERTGLTDLAIFPEPSNFAVYPTIKGEIYFKLTVPGKSTHVCNRHLVAQALPHGVERPGVSALDNMLKYQLATLELERQWLLWRSHPHVPPGGMFVNLNTIRAGQSFGPIPDSSVPDSCEATGSLLFHPDLSVAEVSADVRAAYDRVTQGDDWLRAHPPTLEIPYGHIPKEPVNMPHDHPGVLAIRAATQAVTGADPAVTISPFVCDANYWYPLGQPALVFGPGDPSWGIHGTDEYLPIPDLLRAVKVFAAATLQWCGVADDDPPRPGATSFPATAAGPEPEPAAAETGAAGPPAGSSGEALVGGVDGCAAGWVLATGRADRVGPTSVRVVADFAEIVALVRSGELRAVAVDVPIGLPEREARSCDQQARRLVGPRASSVFPSPVRAVLGAPDFAEANRRSRAASGKGLSRQTFAIAAKIAEADALMSTGLQASIIEVHPEVSFATLAGRPIAHPKKTPEGRAERLGLLAGLFEDVEVHAARRLPGAARDDVLDAYAALWSAGRWAAGTALRLGGEPDGRGLRMEIVA